MGTSNYSWQMVDAAFSSYRLPNLILDEMIERDRPEYLCIVTALKAARDLLPFAEFHD